jgi:hypothetical protein
MAGAHQAGATEMHLLGTSTNRRKALKLGLLVYAFSLFRWRIDKQDETARDGRPDSPKPANGSASPLQAIWDPSPWLMMSSSKPTVTVDMSITLPVGVRRGGIFGLAAKSSALPAGATLTRAGILSIVSFNVGSTSDLIFTYSEPFS